MIKFAVYFMSDVGVSVSFFLYSPSKHMEDNADNICQTYNKLDKCLQPWMCDIFIREKDLKKPKMCKSLFI